MKILEDFYGIIRIFLKKFLGVRDHIFKLDYSYGSDKISLRDETQKWLLFSFPRHTSALILHSQIL